MAWDTGPLWEWLSIYRWNSVSRECNSSSLKGGSFKVGTNNFNNSGSGYTTVGEVELTNGSSRYATVKNVFGTNLERVCLFGRKV